MKKRLNFLCVLIFVLLLSSVVPYVVMGVETTKQAILLAEQDEQKGEEYVNEQMAKLSKVQHPAVLSAIPVAADPAILHNDKTGRDMEVWPTQMILDAGEAHAAAFEPVATVVGVVGGGLQTVVLVLFVLLIVRVNKGSIFDWKNVRWLRVMGGCMVLAASLSMAVGLMLVSQAREVFSASGYVINYLDYTQISNLILGVLALVVAEVFAMGLKQKEELELTV